MLVTSVCGRRPRVISLWVILRLAGGLGAHSKQSKDFLLGFRTGLVLEQKEAGLKGEKDSTAPLCGATGSWGLFWSKVAVKWGRAADEKTPRSVAPLTVMLPFPV